MTIDAITVAIIIGICNLLIVPFVGYVFRSGKALETKQIADNAARKEEITNLGHKIELAAVNAKAGQEMTHRDNSEMKSKLDNLERLLAPLIERLGLHVQASDMHR
ncbi:MAG: hypothetical protein KA763_00530 [Xanthomonadales bacterium]|nr:hypothetical protein [Xanthomonadales bacterium]